MGVVPFISACKAQTPTDTQKNSTTERETMYGFLFQSVFRNIYTRSDKNMASVLPQMRIISGAQFIENLVGG
jgi:hypothetical protein